jgi:hypothetical protein
MLIGLIAASADAFVTIDASLSARCTRRVPSLFYRDSNITEADLTNKRRPDFKTRMRSIVKQQQRKSWSPNNMKTAVTLEEYANVIKEGRERNRIVVANFHATWCKVIIVLMCNVIALLSIVCSSFSTVAAFSPRNASLYVQHSTKWLYPTLTSFI